MGKPKGVVLFSVPSDGHLVGVIELAKQLRQHSSDLSVTLLVFQTTFPSNLSATPSTPHVIEAVMSSGLGIDVVELLPVEPPFEPPAEIADEGMARMFTYLEKLKPSVLEALRSLSNTISISALILDMFCVTMLDVAEELAIPSYVFFIGASGVSLLLYLPTLDHAYQQDFKDVSEMIQVPGWPPLPPLALPHNLHTKDSPAYHTTVEMARRLRRLKGVIVNSYNELEPSAVKALAEGLCVPDGPSPPAYLVGPMIRLDDVRPSSDHACIRWLDQQPKGSVIFLCFGSLGAFSEEQVFEIARGLELIGTHHRFLWSVRAGQERQGMARGSVHGGSVTSAMKDRDGLGAAEALLPTGFVERTMDRGMVWLDRVPQMAILAHPSVGGFVSHCGWNSVLESVWFGVPVVAWPLYAEQRMNAVLLEDGWGLAVGVRDGAGGHGCDYSKIVRGEELERAIRRLMEGEDGEKVRERMARMREAARKAVSEGGSSYSALKFLMAEWSSEGNNHL